MNIDELEKVFEKGETLTCEFKSDRKPLPDKDLISAVVALVNTEGGELYLGVEDDGTVSGVHPNHEAVQGLSTLIAGTCIRRGREVFQRQGRRARDSSRFVSGTYSQL